MAGRPVNAAASAPPRVLALLTCFNRKALTLACLDALATAAREAGVQPEAVLVDDASPDGTAAAVREPFPWVEVIEGNGSLFWNRGMHRAFARGMARGADYYLWLNDDTHLVPGALRNLLAQAAELERREGRPVVLSGATAEPGSSTISYGGRVATSKLKPFKFKLVWSEREPVAITALEGNCVLIPQRVAAKVGNLDPTFEHAMGDTDYGLRTLRAGFGLYLAGGVAGHCSPNPTRGTYFDTSLPLARRWQLIRSRKGLPVRSWLRFCSRHGGLLWPVYFAWPYFKVVATSVPGLLRPQQAR
ncbi:MAG: glycosyltransferase family 2 protein [Rubrivivax sp.]|nr:glycosyltransferase family 2 protein [Rubrivivax sp.]MCL4696288.1 glycosyltransferase family 2 protein [Burkholderiaceae bacterium]